LAEEKREVFDIYLLPAPKITPFPTKLSTELKDSDVKLSLSSFASALKASADEFLDSLMKKGVIGKEKYGEYKSFLIKRIKEVFEGD